VNTYRKSEIPPHLLEFFEPAEIGLEPTPDEFVAKLVAVFREVRRVLRDDGTAWVNMGDSYAANRTYQVASTLMNSDSTNEAQACNGRGQRAADYGVKAKDLLGVPWMLAFALRADGWYLRQDIIWAKPNPMPESVTDRCTKSHEYIFLLSKSATYHCDMAAIAEQSMGRELFGNSRSKGDCEQRQDNDRQDMTPTETRNKRSVWTVSTKPYAGAHFATFPTDLIEPCILAGAPAGGVVLDPFFGSGTTGQVAQALGRRFIGCELNETYKPLQDQRLSQPSLDLEAA
jgi:DNA modification methylase